MAKVEVCLLISGWLSRVDDGDIRLLVDNTSVSDVQEDFQAPIVVWDRLISVLIAKLLVYGVYFRGRRRLETQDKRGNFVGKGV